MVDDGHPGKVMERDNADSPDDKDRISGQDIVNTVGSQDKMDRISGQDMVNTVGSQDKMDRIGGQDDMDRVGNPDDKPTATTDISRLFEARGIAVIGASIDTNKVGYKLLENIVSGGYPGNIYPVNPKGGEVLGLKIYPNITDTEGIVDIACIVVPEKYVMKAAEDCAKKGVKFLLVITSGFSEVGKIEEERRLVEFSKAHGMRVLGPNIFGVFSRTVSLNATFGPKIESIGNVSIITQSGAIGIGMIGKTAIEGIGLSTIISVGNKSDLDEADLLGYLGDNDETRIIMMYIEGIKHGDRIVGILKEITRKKPVIVIKSGRSKRGAVAAASHTGSLAGADEVFDDIMKQCGVIRAEDMEEALDWAKFLSRSPMPKGKNTLIVTNGGGIGVLATDACEKYNVHLYDDSKKLREFFEKHVIEYGSVKNPIDLTGIATAEDYQRILDAAVKNDRIHSVIGLYCETAVFTGQDLIEVIKDANRKFMEAGKPVVFSFFGGRNVENIVGTLDEINVPVFSNVYRAISCLGTLYSHYEYRSSNPVVNESFRIPLERFDRVIQNAREENRHFLLSHEAREIMEAVGIPVPESYIARSLEQAIQYAETIGYPVVLKVVSKDIIHKSDAGGVALDLDNKEEVMDAYQAVTQKCKRYNPNALIEGMEVTEMISRGTETIIGARQDNAFGPICMFGMGGIYVEVMKDVSFRSLPLGRGEVMKMIADIKSYPLLLGVRGEEKKDIRGIADALLNVGAILQQCPDISDIEINPLVVYDHDEGVKAVDVRILLSKEMEAN